jgi:tetrahydromethanopterin S-methyltransferase subunit G
MTSTTSLEEVIKRLEKLEKELENVWNKIYWLEEDIERLGLK